MEIVKFQQAQFINFDLEMYHEPTDTPALCRTSSLVEELGQIEYIFSDKTGTLTRNEMEFRFCTIGGTAYADVVDEKKRAGGDADEGEDGDAWKTFEELRAFLKEEANPFADEREKGGGRAQREREVIKEFLTLLAVCHTVIPEVKEGKMVFQASSPDEAALVAGAELLGYQFHVSFFVFFCFSVVVLTLFFLDAKTSFGFR
jgi:phospholipid-transporting ATPase